MVIAKIKVDGVAAVATELSQIPKGIQGATIEVTYDASWGSLKKTAVFSGSVVKDVVNAGAVIPVPPETVAKSGHRLRVGFYGVDGENKVIMPTLWVDLGAIQSAADPSGDASTNPSLPVWAQLQAEVEALKETGGGSGTGATAEQAAQIAKNKEDIEKLSREKLDASKLPEAVKGIVDEFAVSYNEQTLTEEQKEQARENIGIPEIVCTVSGDVIAVTDSLNRKLRGLNLFGKTTQNGTPTPDSPVELESVGDGGSVAVTVCGKNLLKPTATSQTINGVTFTVNDDGSITANGTATANINYIIAVLPKLPAGNLILTGCQGGSGETYYLAYTNYVNKAYMDFGSGVSMTKFDYTVYPNTKVQIEIRTGAVLRNTVFKPMIRFATETDATYEPYKNGGSVTTQTPNGLPGIPVSSGGNYTDENGQQWICNEIDFTKGKYVQRVKTIQLTSAMEWQVNSANTQLYAYLGANVVTKAGSPILCTHAIRGIWGHNEENTIALGNDDMSVCAFAVSNFPTVDKLTEWLDVQTDGVYAIVPLISPVETDLVAEEIAQYSTLHTSYPYTTVYNDAGAGMAVEYVADTKLYIDNKFTELQNAILSAGANI